MKKKILLISFLGTVFLSFAAGASAASTIEKITASLDNGISFLLNGSTWAPKDGNGNKAAPIIYQGTTYVPLRAVAEATGAEVNFDGAKKQISIDINANEEATTDGQRLPFDEKTVTHVKGFHSSGITRSEADLLFGEVQYNAAFIVNEVNVAKKEFGFTVKEGTKQIGILMGYKDNEDDLDRSATYNITDSKGSSVASGKIEDGKVLGNVIVTNGETEFTVSFESGSTKSVGAGYLIWDESWIEN